MGVDLDPMSPPPPGSAHVMLRNCYNHVKIDKGHLLHNPFMWRILLVFTFCNINVKI